MQPLSSQSVQTHVNAVAEQGYSIMPDAIPAVLLDEIQVEIGRLENVRPGGDIPPPIHDDDSVYNFPRPHPNLVCNTMWALTDFTEFAGATRVVPGSNRWPHDPDLTGAYETIPLLMPAGSIAFVVGSCYHGAGQNTSGQDRVALTINYCNGAMRQQKNLMLGIAPERLLSFTPQLQDLLGFKVCGGAGHIFAQDPRVEMERHYLADADSDPYLARRNELHTQRTGMLPTIQKSDC